MLTVTEAIRIAGCCGGLEWVPDSALLRGRAVHAAVDLYERGKLDATSVHPEVAPRLASWIAWRTEAGFAYERGEFEVTGPGYVGHPDLVGTIRGERWLLDLKCGTPAAWHALQTALYAAALGTPRMRRGAVYLSDDGSVGRLVEHRDRADFTTASAVLAVAAWKKNNGYA